MFSRKASATRFQARSTARDDAADADRAARVVAAIEKALAEVTAERAGLARRYADALTRAALTVGNETDEYATREAQDNQQQRALNDDIRYAERRLKQLDTQIAHYQELRSAADAPTRRAV